MFSCCGVKVSIRVASIEEDFLYIEIVKLTTLKEIYFIFIMLIYQINLNNSNYY